MKLPTTIVVLALFLAGVGLAGFGGARLERLDADNPPGAELLYLPNGKLLRVASLGQSELLADLVYLWAIQFYSDYQREDRYRYVEHVFGNVIAELDPNYLDPYWLGAMILSTEARDSEAAIRLLDKGYENNPDEWVLPYMAGWEHYFAGRFEEASRYFDVASQNPSAPPNVLRMRAGMIGKTGDLRKSAELWQQVLDDPRADEASIAIAGRQVRDLTVKADLKDFSEAIERFRDDNRRNPRTLAELVARGYLGYLPVDPDGNHYLYDVAGGNVSSPAQRLLGASAP
ncbi:MAG: hypothetical protein GY716_07085 [bacterium]|nr:hypothetical protein [bacterium]